MGKKFVPKKKFVASEYVDRFSKPTSSQTLLEVLRDKYPLYADNLAERFRLATGEELAWENISLPNLDRYIQYLRACGLSDNTVRQYGCKLQSALNLYRPLHENIPSSREMSAILCVDKDESYDAYLDDDDLDILYEHLAYLKFHSSERGPHETKGTRAREIMVLTHFLIGADTGARSFDERGLSWDNLQEGKDTEGNDIYVLVYTTNKRGIKASVPLSKKSRVIPLLRTVKPLTVSQRECNYIIKRVCRKAGLTRLVKRRRAGKDIVQELCEAVHFHVGRKSFCTNALKRGSSITDVMQFMGHTNPQQTLGYNCSGPTFLAEAIAKQRKAGNIL